VRDILLLAIGILLSWWGCRNIRGPIREREEWLANWTPEKDRYRREDISPPYWPRLSGYFLVIVAGIFCLWVSAIHLLKAYG
jgi:hypothetical protein